MVWTKAYLNTKWHLDPSSHLAAIDIGPKVGATVPPFGRGSWVPSNTMLPGPRLTFVPCGMLIHPAVWPQHTWAENWGLCPFGGGELGPHLTQWARAEAFLHAKFHLDPSNWLATMHHHKQTGQTTVRWHTVNHFANSHPKTTD